MSMRVLVRGIEFEKLDLDGLMDFLSENKKTQIVDAKCFFGEKHVIHSILQTLKAFRDKGNIARNGELEFLVRLSGQRQIKNALSICRPRKKAVFVSWNKNSGKIFSGLKKKFKTRAIALKEPGKEAQKEAIEKTATFYLSS